MRSGHEASYRSISRDHTSGKRHIHKHPDCHCRAETPSPSMPLGEHRRGETDPPPRQSHHHPGPPTVTAEANLFIRRCRSSGSNQSNHLATGFGVRADNCTSNQRPTYGLHPTDGAVRQTTEQRAVLYERARRASEQPSGIFCTANSAEHIASQSESGRVGSLTTLWLSLYTSRYSLILTRGPPELYGRGCLLMR
jgi:hypothetical protein